MSSRPSHYQCFLSKHGQKDFAKTCQLPSLLISVSFPPQTHSESQTPPCNALHEPTQSAPHFLPSPPSLCSSHTAPLLFPDHVRPVLSSASLSWLFLCLEYSSPRCLHGSLPQVIRVSVSMPSCPSPGPPVTLIPLFFSFPHGMITNIVHVYLFILTWLIF